MLWRVRCRVRAVASCGVRTVASCVSESGVQGRRVVASLLPGWSEGCFEYGTPLALIDPCLTALFSRSLVARFPRSLLTTTQHTNASPAVRSWPIGIRFATEQQTHDLILASLESARITHHHPIAFLSAVTAALFASYALRGIPIQQWGALMLQQLPVARQVVQGSARDVKLNMDHWHHFESSWLE